MTNAEERRMEIVLALESIEGHMALLRDVLALESIEGHMALLRDVLALEVDDIHDGHVLEASEAWHELGSALEAVKRARASLGLAESEAPAETEPTDG